HHGLQCCTSHDAPCKMRPSLSGATRLTIVHSPQTKEFIELIFGKSEPVRHVTYLRQAPNAAGNPRARPLRGAMARRAACRTASDDSANASGATRAPGRFNRTLNA